MFIEGREFYLDELTGAKNRRYLNTFIKKEIKKCKRYNQVFSILLLDLDDFKVINDIHGHLEGDKVLKGFVDFLQRTLRESDEIIRYGGDEFIVFLPNTDREHTVIVAQRILNKIKSVKIEGYKIGVSIGVAGFPRDGKSWDEMFPPEEYYQVMHLKLFPKGLVHAENLGGDIDKVKNKRVWIGAFPLRAIEFESSMMRVVALEPPE